MTQHVGHLSMPSRSSGAGRRIRPVGFLGVCLTLAAVACARPDAKRASRDTDTTRTRPEVLAAAALATRANAPVPFRVPAESEVKDTVVLAAIRRGRAMLSNTRDSLPAHVGNRLRCVSCHMGDGQQANKMPFIGVYARFPQYRPRSATVEIIEDRINDCFERSMNGKALPRDSRPMRDIVAYLAFLSYGIPVGAQVEGQGLPRLAPLPGDTSRGRELFKSKCTQCHGADGQGGRADTAAAIVGPLFGRRHVGDIAEGRAIVDPLGDRGNLGVVQREVVGKFLDADGGVDVPGRHLAREHTLLDGFGPRAHFLVAHQRHGRHLPGAMAVLALGLENGRDVLGEGHGLAAADVGGSEPGGDS